MNDTKKIIENYSGGSLDLSGCDLTGITLPKTVGGSLDLSGCDLTGITLPKTVGGWLYLSGCDLTGVTLPKTVGDSLYLCGSKNLKNAVYNCGENNRTICAYRNKYYNVVVSLGCFIGTLNMCIEAISNKYSGAKKENYISKVKQAFDLFEN
jgi:hypothetical protein